ncbi:putative glucitol transport protein GutA [Vallitalea longa]|uniref:Glucitol transport protein GutA n=1 Tax=Vallitalea longa TaxID=2936439 RepID=A0A9W6DCW5_9FIRM|nr:MFS transporter [Vallitalea longa]GKX27541.1 putative glucitol transport protein GutA [Vallitalea longa]
MDKIYKRARVNEVLKYGVGGIGSNVAFMLVMMYLMFFYTDVLGINAAAVGGLFLVARIIDAVTDPLMGMIADRTKSRWGKFRPWIIFGAPVLGILVIMMFTAPNLSSTGKLIYIYITYILYSIVSTVVNIPYHSLTPVLSEDPDQRTVIATTKQIFGNVGSAFITIGAVPITNALGGDARAWKIYGIICAIIIVISFFVCASGAKEYDNHETITNRKNQNIKFIEQLRLIVNNKALLMLMIAFGTDMIAYAGASAVNIYYFTYAVNRPDLIAVVGAFALVIGLPITFFVPFLSKKFGKKKIYMFSSTVLLFISASLFFIPFTSIKLILLQAVLAAAFAPFTGVVGWAILADCVEYGEWVTGKRGEGTVSSQLTFINKVGMALGGFIVGILLAAVGYEEGVAQTEQTLKAIVGIKALLPAAGYLCSIISMSFYPITKEFYHKMITDNEKRRNSINESAKELA